MAQAAARSLGSIGNPAAAKALLNALPERVCRQPARLLRRIVALRRSRRGQRQAARQAMAIYDRLRDVPAPHQVRTAALRGAILTRQEDGLPLLAQALHSDDFTLFLAAVRTAQEMPGPEVTRLLAGELPGLPADRQILVIQTLAKRADAAALPALFAAARKRREARSASRPSARSRRLATPRPSRCCVELLGDADKDIAEAAQESLAALPGKEVDAAIMKMLADGAAGPPHHRHGPHRAAAHDLSHSRSVRRRRGLGREAAHRRREEAG